MLAAGLFFWIQCVWIVYGNKTDDEQCDGVDHKVFVKDVHFYNKIPEQELYFYLTDVYWQCRRVFMLWLVVELVDTATHPTIFQYDL
jgi:hypothetical protein